MAIERIKTDIALGVERNYDGAVDTPYTFFEPLVSRMLYLLTPEQLRVIVQSKEYLRVVEGIGEMNR